VFFSSFMGFTQTMNISGTVYDTTGQVQLENALAMLIRIKDSVMVDFKRTDKNGFFEFKNKSIDTFQLIVSHFRYSDQSYYIFGNEENKEISIKKITLPPKSQEIKEVIIYAYKDPVFYKGDTLVYIADSFATAPNAVVEDLLKKLPGITVNADGSITSQGKEISQVLVDGDEFFGSDATIATKNLAAKNIEQVQVYEKKDETSTNSDETIQVLDLRLKEDAKKGYFGKVSAASDFNRFYEGEMLANRFNRKQKISAFALTSNTTRSSLEWRDAYKYGISQGVQYNEEDGSWSREFNSASDGTGIPQTFKSGVYFNDQITKSTKLGLNYTYNNSSLLTYEANRSQFFLTDTSYVTNQEATSERRNESHALNIKLEQNIDSLTKFEFEPRLQLNSAITSTKDNTDFETSKNEITRQNLIQSENNAKGMNLNTRVALNRDFMKKGRKLKTMYRLILDENSSDGNLLSKNVSALEFISLNDTIDQEKKNSSKSISHLTTLTYIEPLSPKLKLQLDYEFYKNDNDQERNTFNSIDGSYTDLDLTLSNDFKNERVQNLVGTQFIFENKKQRISLGMRARNVKIKSEDLISLNQVNQNINNLLPSFNYRYKFSNSQQLHVNYRTNSSQPSINQLQPVRDNTNPNRFVEGNPDLLPNYVHNITARLNSYNILTGNYVWAYGSYNYTQDAFANSTDFDNFGRMTSKTVNVDGNQFGNFSLGGGLNFFDKTFRIDPNLSYNYSKIKNLVNQKQNITINNSYGVGTVFRLVKDSIEIDLGGNFNYTQPKSSVSSSSQQAFQTQTYNTRIKLKLPFHFGFESDAEYSINTGRGADYDVNLLIWNASVYRNFLKNENLIVNITMYDILNQSININRFVRDNIITDTRTNIIARYFLVKLTYKFNSSKTKETDENMWH
jgi:outer membrane receptor protein involved in Fe transport